MTIDSDSTCCRTGTPPPQPGAHAPTRTAGTAGSPTLPRPIGPGRVGLLKGLGPTHAYAPTRMARIPASRLLQSGRPTARSLTRTFLPTLPSRQRWWCTPCGVCHWKGHTSSCGQPEPSSAQLYSSRKSLTAESPPFREHSCTATPKCSSPHSCTSVTSTMLQVTCKSGQHVTCKSGQQQFFFQTDETTSTCLINPTASTTPDGGPAHAPFPK